MTHDTLELADQQVVDHTRDLLHAHLSLSADGYVCTTDDLLNVLPGIATNRGTLEAVCRDWVGLVKPETVRGYFNDQLRVEELPALERRLNAALRAEIPRRLWRQSQHVAIDFQDRPYSGKRPQNDGLWVRGRARDGTTRFSRLLTAYVIRKGLRVTLAVRFVLPDQALVGLLDGVLKSLTKQGLHLACLYLDKSFANIDVMAYLTRQAQPALIAGPIRGKTGGTRALCRGRRSYRTVHTFVSGKRSFTAHVSVCRSFTTARRTKRMKRRATWLLYILIQRELSPDQARHQYRRRFGIESSYRCAGQVRGWTTSPNPAYRFVLLTLSFVLLNVWVHLRWCYAQVPRRGRRWPNTKLFEFTTRGKVYSTRSGAPLRLYDSNPGRGRAATMKFGSTETLPGNLASWR